MTFNYDVIVVGAGHAGCEAAAASANLGSKTLLITMDMNKIAQMSCNPAVGGIAKGQIVREIDALGGYMGIVTDRTAIQFRMLNRSKGPAMWSPRAQSDRARFIECWRGILENIPNLFMWQDDVRELLLEDGEVRGVRTGMNVEFRAKAVVLTNGTFLNGLMHIGKTQIRGGRIAEPASTGLTEQLRSLGIRTDRMKTGTPVRIDARSVQTLSAGGCVSFPVGRPLRTRLAMRSCGKASPTPRCITDRLKVSARGIVPVSRRRSSPLRTNHNTNYSWSRKVRRRGNIT